MITTKAPVSPNRGYSRMQHLWFTERVIDIVAHELGLDPVEIRKRNYVRADEMPYTTPNGCVYDSGDYAQMLDVALDLIGYDALEARRAEAEGRATPGPQIPGVATGGPRPAMHMPAARRGADRSRCSRPRRGRG